MKAFLYCMCSGFQTVATAKRSICGDVQSVSFLCVISTCVSDHAISNV